MKTETTSETSISQRFRNNFALVIMLAVLTLASCSDDDKATEPDTRQQFVGTYIVKDISASSGYNYEYSVNISMGSKGDLEISNFGDVMNVPVKAKAKGNQLIIPSQTFKNPSGKTLTVTGSGTLASNVLTFNYTTAGYIDYTGNCTAEKGQ